MTFNQYWQKLETANPALKSSAKVTFTIEQLKKQLRKAYENGRVDGLKQLDDGLSMDFASFFKSLGM